MFLGRFLPCTRLVMTLSEATLLNPPHPALARRIYRFQSRVLHIPDSLGSLARGLCFDCGLLPHHGLVDNFDLVALIRFIATAGLTFSFFERMVIGRCETGNGIRGRLRMMKRLGIRVLLGRNCAGELLAISRGGKQQRKTNTSVLVVRG